MMWSMAEADYRCSLKQSPREVLIIQVPSQTKPVGQHSMGRIVSASWTVGEKEDSRKFAPLSLDASSPPFFLLHFSDYFLFHCSSPLLIQLFLHPITQRQAEAPPYPSPAENRCFTTIECFQRGQLTVDVTVDDSNSPPEPGMCSSPLSAIMQSSLVRHICEMAKLMYICLLYNLSASSIANGTSRAS